MDVKPIGMAHPTGPIEIKPEFSHLMDQVIRRFGGERELEVESWYHDEPLWILWKRVNRLVRRLQVAVFDADDERQIRIIPDACIIEVEGQFIRTIPFAEHKAISLPTPRLWKPPWYVFEERGEVRLLEEELYSKLQRAWELASKIEETDCTVEIS